MAQYQIGVKVRVSWIIQTLGADADPAGMTFKYKHLPSGTVTILTMGVDAALVKDSVGHYHVDITTTAEGTIYYRVDATGVNMVANQGVMDVVESYF